MKILRGSFFISMISIAVHAQKESNINTPKLTFLLKVNLNGKIANHKWIDTINHPIGSVLHKNRLTTYKLAL